MIYLNITVALVVDFFTDNDYKKFVLINEASSCDYLAAMRPIDLELLKLCCVTCNYPKLHTST